MIAEADALPLRRREVSTGRAFRALRLLALLLGLWLVGRVPLIIAEAREAVAAMRPLKSIMGSHPPPPLLAQLLHLSDTPLPLPQAMVPVTPGHRASQPPAKALPLRRPKRASPADAMPFSPLAAVANAAIALPAGQPAGDVAAQAYRLLASGDRRGAVAAFDAALALADAPRRAQWRAARDRLLRHWSGDAYVLVRAAGLAGAAAGPVLGGGQSGASLAYALDPLARRPLAIVARLNTASDAGGAPRADTLQAAIGLRWQIRPGFSISGERLMAIGELARNDWTLRVAGGGDGHVQGLVWNLYGEAGVQAAGDGFAGGQARLTKPVIEKRGVTVLAGIGAWGSVQGDGQVHAERLDIGPSVAATLARGPITLNLSADWRFRVAGSALPGSGPAVTLSAQF